MQGLFGRLALHSAVLSAAEASLLLLLASAYRARCATKVIGPSRELSNTPYIYYERKKERERERHREREREVGA